jgi:hypothetical protein
MSREDGMTIDAAGDEVPVPSLAEADRPWAAELLQASGLGR